MKKLATPMMTLNDVTAADEFTDTLKKNTSSKCDSEYSMTPESLETKLDA